MIFIKSVEVLKVPENYWKHMEAINPKQYPYFNTPEIYHPEIREELVMGKRFRNAEGLDVVIGMINEVQLAIGLPMEAFNNQETTIEYQNNIIANYSSMGFWSAIYWAFRKLRR